MTNLGEWELSAYAGRTPFTLRSFRQLWHEPTRIAFSRQRSRVRIPQAPIFRREGLALRGHFVASAATEFEGIRCMLNSYDVDCQILDWAVAVRYGIDCRLRRSVKRDPACFGSASGSPLPAPDYERAQSAEGASVTASPSPKSAPGWAVSFTVSTLHAIDSRVAVQVTFQPRAPSALRAMNLKFTPLPSCPGVCAGGLGAPEVRWY